MDGGMDVCVYSYNPSNRYHEDMVVGECIQSTCPVTSSSFAFQTPCSITGWLTAYFTYFSPLINPSIHSFISPSLC